MGAGKIKSFYESEVAMLEHELVQECHPMEMDMDNGNWIYYYSGIHDMAEKILDSIRKGDGY